MVVQNVFSGTLVELSQDAMLHSYRMQIHVDVLVFIFLDSFRQISLNGEWREKPNVWTSDAQVGKTEIAAASRTGSNYRHDFFINFRYEVARNEVQRFASFRRGMIICSAMTRAIFLWPKKLDNMTLFF